MAAAPLRSAVLVLGYDSRDHLEDCFDALARQDVFAPGSPGEPRDSSVRDEVIFIDNASTDDSVEFVRRRFPWVRIIENAENLGFCRAYNAAAEANEAAWVVFLNPDTRVEPDWLSKLHAARDAHPDADALASRMMRWDEDRIDFIGGDTTFYGHAFQIDLDMPAEGRSFEDAPLLFGCAGSLMVGRDMFVRIGGFDPDYFSYFEDVDFGWRAALLGNDTRLAAGAVTRHRMHGTWGRFGLARRLVLLERNAFANVRKNFERGRSGRMLLASAILSFIRGWAASGSLVRERGRRCTACMLGHLLGMAGFLRIADGVEQRRDAVQSARVRSDREVLPRFGDFTRRLEGLAPPHDEAFDCVVRLFGLASGGLPEPSDDDDAARETALRIFRICADAVSDRYDEDWMHAENPEMTAEYPLCLGGWQKLNRCFDTMWGFLAEHGDRARFDDDLRRIEAIPRKGSLGWRARAAAGSLFGRGRR